MECPKCNFIQPDGGTECIKCGIVFGKYASKRQHRNRNISVVMPPAPQTAEEAERAQIPALLKELFLNVKPEMNIFSFIGRVLLFLVILGWGLALIFTPMESNYSGESFMHNINLPFHEAGHIFFRFFGSFMAVLGGSLMQLLVPLICMLTLLLKTRDPFGASVCLWWTGESMIDLAPYINDARALKLILLGGVTGRDVDDYHDWEFILRELGLLRSDHLIAKATHGIGAVLIACAAIWAGLLLYKQFRNSMSLKDSLQQ